MIKSELKPFTSRVIEIIKSIPSGRVMTYGQIAKFAGNARGARQVVRILHSMSAAYELPWHRVVNVKGEVAMKDEEARHVQCAMLNGENIDVDESGRLDLKTYQYWPDELNVRHPFND